MHQSSGGLGGASGAALPGGTSSGVGRQYLAASAGGDCIDGSYG